MRSHDPNPMLARPATATGSRAQAQAAGRRGTALPADADPDATVDEILSLLDQDRYRTARELAAAVVERFPDHRRARKVWTLFDVSGRARVGAGGPEPPTDEEFAWLRDPPAWARGKWVALVGSEAVAVGDSLAEVQESLESSRFSKRPLVHHIDDV